jgi:hypothetical protein
MNHLAFYGPAGNALGDPLLESQIEEEDSEHQGLQVELPDDDDDRANSFHMPGSVIMATVVIMGMHIGKIIFAKIFQYEAPSMRAASTSEIGIPRMYSVIK